MEGVIQTVCIQIVQRMNRQKQYSDSEKKVLVYGLELIFDSLLKALIYLTIGLAFGKGKEVAVIMFIFGVLRKTSGGRHAKTDIGCLGMTGAILAVSVGSPPLFSVSDTVYIVFSAATLLIYLEFAPNDEYYRAAEKRGEMLVQKKKSILLASFILAMGYVLGEYWKMAFLCVVSLQSITLVNMERS